MKRFLLCAVFFALLFTNCANYREINIVDADIRDARILSAVKYQADLMIEVDNPSGTKFVIELVEGGVKMDGKPFAKIFVHDKVIVPAKGVNEVVIRCEISLIDPLSALAVGMNYKSMDWGRFTVDAKGIIKGGPVKKKKEFSNISVKRLYDYIKKKV